MKKQKGIEWKISRRVNSPNNRQYDQELIWRIPCALCGRVPDSEFENEDVCPNCGLIFNKDRFVKNEKQGAKA